MPPSLSCWAILAASTQQSPALPPAPPRPGALPSTPPCPGALPPPSPGNYEFGLGRVMRALEPLASNLDGLRWAGAKFCLLGALDQAAKQMLVLKARLGLGVLGIPAHAAVLCMLLCYACCPTLGASRWR